MRLIVEDTKSESHLVAERGGMRLALVRQNALQLGHLQRHKSIKSLHTSTT